jgi:Major Facilitator Superfamily
VPGQARRSTVGGRAAAGDDAPADRTVVPQCDVLAGAEEGAGLLVGYLDDDRDAGAARLHRLHRPLVGAVDRRREEPADVRPAEAPAADAQLPGSGRVPRRRAASGSRVQRHQGAEAEALHGRKLAVTAAFIRRGPEASPRTRRPSAGTRAGIAFWLRVRGCPDALLDLGLFRSRTFVASVAVGFTMTLTFASVLFFEALYLERVRAQGPVGTGLLFLPMTALFGALSLQAARVERRFGHWLPALAGLAIASAGSVMLALDRPTTLIAQPVCGLALIGLGLGLGWTNVTSVGLRSVLPGSAGQAAGILFTARWIGGTFGIAVLGLAYRLTADASLRARRRTLPIPSGRRYGDLDGLLSGAVPAHAALAGIPVQGQAAVTAAVRAAASSGTAAALTGVAAAAAAGSLLCLLFRTRPGQLAGAPASRPRIARPAQSAVPWA